MIEERLNKGLVRLVDLRKKKLNFKYNRENPTLVNKNEKYKVGSLPLKGDVRDFPFFPRCKCRKP